MAVIRAIARPMLASMFIIGGIDALRHPEAKAPAAESVTDKVIDQIPGVTTTAQLVQLDGAVKVVAGSLLALGKLPRLSSLALAGSLVPTTIAAHRFWEKDDPKDRAMQKIQFFKNLSMLGGLIISAVDTGGKPDLIWRAGKAKAVLVEKAQSASESVQGTVEGVLHH